MKRRFGSKPDLAGKKASQTSQSAQDLVRKVMETSGGDNAELARKVHERFDKCAPIPFRTPGLLCSSVSFPSHMHAAVCVRPKALL